MRLNAALSLVCLTLTPMDAAAGEAVTRDALMGHLRALQDIADEHGSRAVATSGYAASVDYVAGALEDAGYAVTRQAFDVPVYRELGPSILEGDAAYAYDEDFNLLGGSAPGQIEGPALAVDLFGADAATSGCEAEDFAGFEAGAVAVLRRGTCPFKDKALNAIEAGAVGVVVVNHAGEEGLIRGSLGDYAGDAPVFLARAGLAQALADSGRLVMDSNVERGTAQTQNVLAEAKGRASDRVVMVGAHLDSVPKGPGINDNGSGTAAVLEIALALRRASPATDKTVRFAFWGAEEIGLLGARHYVETLDEAARGRLDLYLNLDMVGSPNGASMFYDSVEDGRAPKGSAAIEAALAQHFVAEGEMAEPTPMRGGSDHAVFARAGVPVGGLYSGAFERKSEAQARLYGGEAGARMDACYHQACDDIDNIDPARLEALAAAAADAIVELAEVRVNG